MAGIHLSRLRSLANRHGHDFRGCLYITLFNHIGTCKVLILCPYTRMLLIKIASRSYCVMARRWAAKSWSGWAARGAENKQHDAFLLGMSCFKA